MGRRAIVHIGTYKTGSTSIQTLLDVNADLLNAEGVYFPKSPGRPNHHGLAVYALSADRTTGLIRYLNLHDGEAREERRADIAAALNAELTALSPRITTVVFSNEHLSGLAEAEIARLKALLAPNFEDVKILVYLRRQDQRIISDYTEKVRDGYVKELDLLSYQPAETRDYSAFLEKWANVFGKENIAPRAFSRTAFINGDLIDDFLDAIGATVSPALARPETENLGLSDAAIRFLRAFNDHVPAYVDGVRNWKRQRLLPFLAEGFPGDGLKVVRSDAEAMLRLVAESNAALGEAYFNGASPFTDDLSRYEDKLPPAASFDDAVKIAAFLWTKQAETIEPLKDEVDRLQQKLLAMRLLIVGDSALTRSYAERLLADDPDAAAYYPTLLDVFMALHRELQESRGRLARNSAAAPAYGEPPEID